MRPQYSCFAAQRRTAFVSIVSEIGFHSPEPIRLAPPAARSAGLLLNIVN